MKRACMIAVAAWTALVSSATAEMVVERWGSGGRVQHKSVTYQDDGDAKRMTVALAPLSKDTRIYRARLVVLGGEGYEVGCMLPGGKEVGLALVPPYDLWFDATDVVSRAVAAGGERLELTLRSFSGFEPEKTFLEVAYEGKLTTGPPQVTGLKAFFRNGQVFLTWKEIWDIAGGNPEIRWGEMVDKVADCTPLGITPVEKDREIRYRVYRHTQPITARNIGEARLLYSVKPGSVYTEERVPWAIEGEHGPRYLKKGEILKRVTLEPGKPLPPGTGFHWYTVDKGGRGYYAVLTAVNGVENTADISSANSVGPIEQRVRTPMPILYRDVVTKLRQPEGAEHHEQWYTWWVPPPLSPYPKRYDVVLSFCRQTMLRPAPLTVTRGHAWITTPEPPGPGPHQGVYLAPSPDNPCAFWMGIPNSYYNLKSRRQARWRPTTQLRNDLLIEWVRSKLPIDPDRIVGSIGCWGMMEIERAELYAYLHGWGQPEMTKGFQAWGRAQIWGPPQLYAGRPKEENPWYRQDYGRWIVEDPARETPLLSIHLGWGAHFTEMGWPPFPRFLRAMIDSKRPLIYRWQVREQRRPIIRKNQSVPAFGNCSLDDNVGNGDLNHGYPLDSGQLNGYLNWDSETIVDRPDRWEMTVVLDDSAPLGECRVDVTPRKVQRFRGRAGQRFRWVCTFLPLVEPDQKPKGGRISSDELPARPAIGKQLGSGSTVADQWGLVTIRQMRMLKGAQRVVIVRQ